MAWLVGIIVVIIAIRFWRISLPLLGIAVVGIGGWLLNEYHEQEQRTAERERNKVLVSQKVADARANASDTDREWEVYAYEDPASGQQVPRMARVKSNDGLCWLTLEKRIDGSELAGLNCELLKLSERDDAEVKFDNYPTSDPMDLRSYNDSSGVFITSIQPTYGNKLPYDEFVRRLRSGKAVSIKVKSSNAGTHWITFTLNGSTEAIAKLYGGA